MLHRQRQCYPQAHQGNNREIVVYPHLGEGCDKGCMPVNLNSSGCSLPIRSLVLNKFLQDSIWHVSVNLTPARMGLTNIRADCGAMRKSQATSGMGL